MTISRKIHFPVKKMEKPAFSLNASLKYQGSENLNFPIIEIHVSMISVPRFYGFVLTAYSVIKSVSSRNGKRHG